MIRFSAAFAFASLFTVSAAAQEAGIAIILDVQNPDQVAAKFCVYDSKVYSPNAEICVSKSSKLTCSVSETDPARGLVWVQSDDAKRCGTR